MIEKICILRNYFYACSVYFKNRNRNEYSKDKKVLILFQQIFGDAVMISDSLQYYADCFPKEDGYSITFVSKPVVNKFMHEVLPLPTEIDFEELDFKRIQTDLGYFKQMIKKYGRGYGTVVVPGSSYSSELFSITSTARKKVGLLPSFPRTKPFLLVWLQKKAYTDTVRTAKEMNMIQRHRVLLNFLGSEKAKGKIPVLLKQERLFEGKYCVICPGSSMSFKIWPIERFATIIDYIIEKYDFNIILTGGKGEEKYSNEIMKKSINKERIVSKIGNTSFREWASLVQYSDLVLGNDSATIHLAAAARRPSICIAGIYEKLQFFPYTVDELCDGDILPITLLSEMACEYCRTKAYFEGYGNKECKKRIKKGLSASCIEMITVERVKQKIDLLMEEVNHE